jgi:hypothetical protein
LGEGLFTQQEQSEFLGVGHPQVNLAVFTKPLSRDRHLPTVVRQKTLAAK